MIAIVVLTVFLNGQPIDEKKIQTAQAWEVCEIVRDEIIEQGRLEARCTMAR